jgi:hypothetical protein
MAQSQKILDPMERMSELLFGLIMALTFTCALGVATADTAETHTMVVAALGCNLAWGIIDGGLFLLTAIHDKGSRLVSLKELRAADAAAGLRIIADALPPMVASVMPAEQLATIREKLLQMPDTVKRRLLDGKDFRGAIAVLVITFVSTFPVVIPFMLIADFRTALRTSNAVAVAMLFVSGYAFGKRAGVSPAASGAVLVVLGSALVAVAIALGG